MNAIPPGCGSNWTLTVLKVAYFLLSAAVRKVRYAKRSALPVMLVDADIVLFYRLSKLQAQRHLLAREGLPTNVCRLDDRIEVRTVVTGLMPR